MRAGYSAGDGRERPAAVYVMNDKDHQIMSFMVPDPNTAYDIARLVNRYFEKWTPDSLVQLAEYINRIAFYWARDAQPYEPDEEEEPTDAR